MSNWSLATIIGSIMLIIIFAQRWHSIGLQNQVDQLVAQIAQLHQDAIKAQKDADSNAADATQEVKRIDSDEGVMMLAKVPHDCQAAINWGISQAQAL